VLSAEFTETKSFSQKHVGTSFLWVAETKEKRKKKKERENPQRD